jgi:hypothetical protein
MPYVNSVEKTITDSVVNRHTYIHVEKDENDLVTIFTANKEEAVRATWTVEEVHEIMNMLYQIID